MVIIKDIDIFNDEDMLDSISDMSFKTFGFGVLFCIAFAIFVPHETFDDGWCILRWLIGIGAGLTLTSIIHNVLYACTSVCCSHYGVLGVEDGSASGAPVAPVDFPPLKRKEIEDSRVDGREDLKVDGRESFKADGREDLKADGRESFKVDGRENPAVDVQDICYTKHAFVCIMMTPTLVLTCVLAALAFVDYAPLGTCIVGTLHLLGCAIDWAIVRAIKSDNSVKYVADTGSGVRLYAEDDDAGTRIGQRAIDKAQKHTTESDHLSNNNENTEVYGSGDEIV